MTGKSVTRRQFLRHAGATAAMLGLSEALIPQLASALQQLATSGKPAVIWIQGQSCTGCSVSFLNSNYPSVADLVINKLSVRYHPTLMAGTGRTAIQAIEDTVAGAGEGQPFVLVAEGPVPTAENGLYCTFGLGDGTRTVMDKTVPNDKTYAQWLDELVPAAAAVIANGNCAAFGGIPGANAKTTGATAISEYVKKVDSTKTVINVGGCPSHPDWFVGTVMEALISLGLLPGGKGRMSLDKYGRSRTFFGQLIHENCERRPAFDAGLFLQDWNQQDPDMKLCMFKKGCKGPVTYADCCVRRWNSKVSWCVGASAPCHGCAEPTFYQELAPLYEPLANVSLPGVSTSADIAGWVAAGATAVGIGAHYLYKQLGEKEPKESSEGGER
ncbi:MAG: hydrogenase small subunit [Actinomycetota bacterium]